MRVEGSDSSSTDRLVDEEGARCATPSQKPHPHISPSGHVTGVPPNFEILATPLMGTRIRIDSVMCPWSCNTSASVTVTVRKQFLAVESVVVCETCVMMMKVLTLVNCSEDDIHWRLDTDSQHASDTVSRGIFRFVHSTGTPLCSGHVCGCLSCGESETLYIQFCASEWRRVSTDFIHYMHYICITLRGSSAIPFLQILFLSYWTDSTDSRTIK